MPDILRSGYYGCFFANNPHIGHTCVRGWMKNNLSMRYTTIAIIAIVAAGLSASAITPALAQNAHFVSATATVNNNGQLVVNWKEAGLGDNQNIDYELTAQASASYECLNKPGKNPSAANKEEVTAPVGATGTFASGKNGQITGSFTVNPPPSTSALKCGQGQTATLVSVTYTNIQLKDVTNNIQAPVPSTASRTF
jgi:hypothetical protein